MEKGLKSLEANARQFVIDTLTELSGHRPSAEKIERVSQGLVNVIKPALDREAATIRKGE